MVVNKEAAVTGSRSREEADHNHVFPPLPTEKCFKGDSGILNSLGRKLFQCAVVSSGLFDRDLGEERREEVTIEIAGLIGEARKLAEDREVNIGLNGEKADLKKGVVLALHWGQELRRATEEKSSLSD